MGSKMIEWRRRRSAGMAAALVAGVGLSLSLGSASALAAGGSHPNVGEFDRSGPGLTEPFSHPNGIAVDEATGDVYVAAIGTDAVYKFDAAGKPVALPAVGLGAGNELTGSATPATSFSFPNVYGTPAALAVDNSKSPSDPSAGDLYVMDAGHGVIDKFSPSGEYISQIAGFPASTGAVDDELLGLGIDGSGTVHVYLRREGVYTRIAEFDDAIENRLIAHQEWSPGNISGYVGLPEGRHADGFAVSLTGDNYPVFEPSCSCTLKFGQRLSPLGRVDAREAGDVAVAVDPASGHLYADDQSSVAEWDTGAMNRNSVPKNNYVAGTLVTRFGSTQLSGSSGQGGIAVNGRTGEIYVSNPENGKVYVFASDAPAVTINEPTGVTKEVASLSGTVDPRGTAVSSCEFQWGLTDELGNGPYDHSVPCKQTPAEIGTGSSPVSVSAQLEGLKSGELYHFRLVATNANGAEQSSGLLATQGEGFGIKSFEISFLNKDGTPDTQAGSHPFKFLTVFELNSHFKHFESTADSPYLRMPDGVLRDLTIDLPPGFVGDPNATTKKCVGSELRLVGCPLESIVGRLLLSWGEGAPIAPNYSDALSNMEPPRGVAVQLGANFFGPLLYINNGVPAGEDYPVQVSVTDAPGSAPVIKSRTEIYGVVDDCVKANPGTGSRIGYYAEGVGTYEGNSTCTEPAAVNAANVYERKISAGKPFLTMPTGCHGPLRARMAIDSWEKPGELKKKEAVTQNSAGTPLSLTGCSELKFPPTITVSPDTTDASTSSGLTVGVHVSQKGALNPEGLAESALRDTTVTLPEGVAINPSGSDGLEACSEGLIGYEGKKKLNPDEPEVKWTTFTPNLVSSLVPGVSFCPNGSKIGTVKIQTPLLDHELEGAVYLAAQNANPFGSLVAMYLVAEDPYSSSLIKLAGEVSLSPTGQIVTTFKNTPDLPFENLELHFFGGERAPLSTPSRCGTYTTEAVFTPWDGNGPVHSTSSFNIDHGPGGGPCPGASLPFNPTLTAGTTSIQAGGFSPFTMTMSREDGQQNMQAITLKMPPGLSGLLTGVELCGEAQANAGTCGPNSQIGETIVSVGVGNAPFTVTGGKVYLTGPYKGAPFGLSIVNPAKAGPYDLGQVIVRAKIEVDPLTADLTVTSDNEGPYKIPTIIQGIPLQIKHVNVTINRPGFTFNPTDCNPLNITGAIHSTEGGIDTVNVPFQATNCARLSFKPSFQVSTSGKTSRLDGASLHVKLTYPKLPFGSQANIASVKVDLPKQLPSNLEALKHACIDTTFNANPAACPEQSRVGSAMATTPLIPVPLTGPAYFVSHGGAKFPELIVVLQGYGVTVDLHGETFINKAGITSSTFHTIPDVPVGTFELSLPERPKYAALAAPGGLCKITKTVLVKKRVRLKSKNGKTRMVIRKIRRRIAANLVMPTAFNAQNGAVIHENTPISVTGCGKAKKSKARKHRRKRKK